MNGWPRTTEELKAGGWRSAGRFERCRACGAQILFARSEGGNWMPLEQVEASGLLLDKGEDYWQSHFATCPQAAKFRRPPIRARGVR